MRFHLKNLALSLVVLASVSTAFADPRIDGAPSRPDDNYFDLARLTDGQRCDPTMTFERLRSAGGREFRAGGESFVSLRQTIRGGDPHFRSVQSYALERIYVGKRHTTKTPAQVMAVYSRFNQHARRLANNSFITSTVVSPGPGNTFRVRYTQRGIQGITNGDAIYDVEDRIVRENATPNESYVLTATGIGSNANVFAPIWSSGTFRADPAATGTGSDVVACNYMVPRLTNWICTARAPLVGPFGPCLSYTYRYFEPVEINGALGEYRTQVYNRVRQTAENLIRWVDSESPSPEAAVAEVSSRLAR